MTTIFSAPKMDLVFFTLKEVKLRQRRALCYAPCLTVNAMKETSIKKQTLLIPSSPRLRAFFQNNKKKQDVLSMHTNATHRMHFNKLFYFLKFEAEKDTQYANSFIGL